jgi:hypothetical protein
MNIDKIDASLIQIMSDLASTNLEEKSQEERESTALAFFGFCALMEGFPLEKRRINLELAIAGYQACDSISYHATII